MKHELELDDEATWPDSRAAKRKFRCRVCRMSGNVLIRPAHRLDEFIALLREAECVGREVKS